MLVLSELPLNCKPQSVLIVPVSPRRFLELALQGGLDARVPWETAFALTKLLEVPFPTVGECQPDNIPGEFLIATFQNGKLCLFHAQLSEI